MLKVEIKIKNGFCTTRVLNMNPFIPLYLHKFESTDCKRALH